MQTHYTAQTDTHWHNGCVNITTMFSTDANQCFVSFVPVYNFAIGLVRSVSEITFDKFNFYLRFVFSHLFAARQGSIAPVAS